MPKHSNYRPPAPPAPYRHPKGDFSALGSSIRRTMLNSRVSELEKGLNDELMGVPVGEEDMFGDLHGNMTKRENFPDYGTPPRKMEPSRELYNEFLDQHKDDNRQLDLNKYNQWLQQNRSQQEQYFPPMRPQQVTRRRPLTQEERTAVIDKYNRKLKVANSYMPRNERVKDFGQGDIGTYKKDKLDFQKEKFDHRKLRDLSPNLSIYKDPNTDKLQFTVKGKNTPALMAAAIEANKLINAIADPTEDDVKYVMAYVGATDEEKKMIYPVLKRRLDKSFKTEKQDKYFGLTQEDVLVPKDIREKAEYYKKPGNYTKQDNVQKIINQLRKDGLSDNEIAPVIKGMRFYGNNGKKGVVSPKRWLKVRKLRATPSSIAQRYLKQFKNDPKKAESALIKAGYDPNNIQ